MFEVLLKLNNISIKKVNLDENYSLDLTSILKEINKKTKIIFLCSPNNPTGLDFYREFSSVSPVIGQ